MSEQVKTTPASIRNACENMMADSSIGGTFTVKNRKVCYMRRNGDEVEYTALCDPFEVLGRTYSEEGDNSALLVRFFADRAKQSLVEVTVPVADLVADPKKVVAMLAGRGLWVAAKRDSILKVGELLSLIRPENDVVTASRPGWYDGVFVSPTGEVFGSSEMSYRLSENIRYADPETSGDLHGWCDATQAALESATATFCAWAS